MFLPLRVKADIFDAIYDEPIPQSSIVYTNNDIYQNRIITYPQGSRIITSDYQSRNLKPTYYYNNTYNYIPQRRPIYQPFSNSEHIVGYDYGENGRIKSIRTITNYNPPIYQPSFHNQPPRYGSGNYISSPNKMMYSPPSMTINYKL